VGKLCESWLLCAFQISLSSADASNSNKGVLNHHFAPANLSDNDEIQQPVAVDLLVTGSVPAGSGLSSSAAMVVASTLAFLAVNGKVKFLGTFLLFLLLYRRLLARECSHCLGKCSTKQG
jgi:hypothetical protein